MHFLNAQGLDLTPCLCFLYAILTDCIYSFTLFFYHRACVSIQREPCAEGQAHGGGAVAAHKVGYAGLAAGLYQFLKHGFKSERIFGLFGFAIGILAKYYARAVVKLAGV